MPFTTKEIVKKHILEHHVGSSLIVDEPLRLTGADVCRLQNRMILASSEAVKARERNEPIRESINFASDDSAALAHQQLVPDSVVVAGDSSLGRIYIENVDYHVDYSLGAVRRIATGAIPPGAVVVWYQYYRIYQRGVDYDIDYQGGTIRRRSSGDIEAGQWVLADYTTEYGSLDDAAIENAIVEANQQVLVFIDPAHANSTDRALVSAETYLSVAILCRVKAMESMSPLRAKSGNSEAGSWAAIGDIYRKEAFKLLAPFAAALGNLNSPSTA